MVRGASGLAAGATILFGSLTGCSGTFGAAPPPNRAEEPLDAVIPPDFDELPVLDLEWLAAEGNPDAGVLRGILPNGEVVAGRILIRDLPNDSRDLDTGVAERGFESGADVFSPFPERWPPRTNNVLNPLRSSRIDVTLGTEIGRVVECELLLNDTDRGLMGGARGVCVDPDGTRFRTLVSPG